MTEDEMDKADKKELEAKVENARSILRQVNFEENLFKVMGFRLEHIL